MEKKKTYSLIKDGEGEFSYLDQDGVSWNNPYQWLWGFLGGCGCGSADEFAKEAFNLLEDFDRPHGARNIDIYGDRFYELMAHWFDKVFGIFIL